MFMQYTENSNVKYYSFFLNFEFQWGSSDQIRSDQSLSHVRLFETP